MAEVKSRNPSLAAPAPATNLPPEFDIRDFDISRDGREVVLERVQGHSDVVLLDLHKP